MRFLSSSIGKKIVVALTGLVLVGFVFGHMIGHLLMFAGPAAYNEYAHFLHTVGHGMGIWVARAVVFGSIIVHVLFTIQLTKQNRAARAEPYGYQHTQVASKSSRVMIISGLTLLSFFIYHILHFTVRVWHGFNQLPLFDLAGEKVFDAYQMMIKGFSFPLVTGFYILSMVFLCSHLSHGVASIPQTLGFNTEASGKLFKKLGLAFAFLILAGFSVVPLAINMGLVK